MQEGGGGVVKSTDHGNSSGYHGIFTDNHGKILCNHGKKVLHHGKTHSVILRQRQLEIRQKRFIFITNVENERVFIYRDE